MLRGAQVVPSRKTLLFFMLMPATFVALLLTALSLKDFRLPDNEMWE